MNPQRRFVYRFFELPTTRQLHIIKDFRGLIPGLPHKEQRNGFAKAMVDNWAAFPMGLMERIDREHAEVRRHG